MADVMKVTQPLTGYENTPKGTTAVPPEGANIQNVVNPQKVVRSDQKQGYEQKQFGLSYESNFGNFLQALRENPSLIESFTQLMFTNMESVVSSGINENFAEEIAKFLEMIQLSGEGSLLSLLKGQNAATEKFQGAFYQLLRHVMDDSQSLDLKAGILDFIKKSNDMSSGQHLLRNIEGNLKQILQLMLPGESERLQELMEKMNFHAPDGEVYNNSAMLKQAIVPMLSQYITKTHDLGKIRDIITLLTLNIARYENGSKEGVLQSFIKLLNFNEFRGKMEGITPDNLMAILHRTNMAENNSFSDWMEQLISMMNRALDGDAGAENKAVFRSMMTAMLLNESVYMPLMHMMFPVNYEGVLMFSELWIDPDAEQEEGHERKGKDGKTIKGLVKFDIKDVGFFDVVFQFQDDSLNLQIYYPERLASMESEISNKVASIVANNGLEMREFSLAQCIRPKTLTEVFPKIYEGRDSVNVRV